MSLCSWLLCALLCLDEPAEGGLPALPLLHAGDTLTARLVDGLETIEGHGLARAYRFEPGVTGLVTFSLSSHDFDAYLRVEEVDGDGVWEDDDSGIETNAMLVIRALEGQRYRVLLGASGPGKGVYSITCATGRVPLPYGAERDQCVIRHWAECASRALEREDEQAAARHTLRLGDKLSDCAHYEEALEALEEARDLAIAVEDQDVEVLAHYKLAFCHFGRGDVEAARASFLEHVRLAREYRQPAEELLGLGMLCEFYRRDRQDQALVAALGRRAELAGEVNDPREQRLILDELIEVHGKRHETEKLHLHLVARLRLAESAEENEHERLQLMVSLASTELELGDQESAGRRARTARALARRLGASEREATLEGVLARLHAAAGQPRLRQAAVDRLQQLRELGRSEMQPWLQAAATTALLGLAEAGIEVRATAESLADELLELTLDITAERVRLRALRVKGDAHRRAGRHAAARRLLEEALELAVAERYRFHERQLRAALQELPDPPELPE